MGHGDLAPEAVPDICHAPRGREQPDGAVIAEMAARPLQGPNGKVDDRDAERRGRRLDGTRLLAALREWPRGPVIGPLALDRVKGQAGR